MHQRGDGNVLLHETFKRDNSENVELTTWVFEVFVPTAKLVNGKAYSIISDHLGTPILAIDSEGNEVWNRQLDIYGRVKREIKASYLGDDVRPFIPFLYQGQYYDVETKLAYNRFRYYSPETGAYISQDPIRLLGGDNLYSYVHDVNILTDIFGLDVTIGQVGTYKELTDLSKPFDGIDIHHIPQDKLGFLPKNEGIAIAIPHSEHKDTRTYKGRGLKTAYNDKNRLFKDILKDDLVDLRKIGGDKYDDSIKQIIKEYEKLGLLKKGELTLNKIKEACK